MVLLRCLSILAFAPRLLIRALAVLLSGGTPERERCGVMMRLLHDRRGNTLVIMTAALIPLAGMVGGSIDVSRMYILKIRLQHACDAGALAGRKAMGGSAWSYSNYYPRTQANQFFDGNFASGVFSSTNLSRTYTEAAGKVTGTASASIPMTLMRIFGQTSRTVSVTCDADMRLPNTDVMFVLDTTGSMGDTPAGDSMNKISSLKIAVKCFYEIVARLDTDADCTTGTPSGGTGSQVQIRFGFVPYAMNANVGRLLKPEWFRDLAPYQTRRAQHVQYALVNKNPQNDWSVAETYGSTAGSDCDARSVPADGAFDPMSGESSPVEHGTLQGMPPTPYWVTYQYGRYKQYRRVYDAAQRQCRIEAHTVFADQRAFYNQAGIGVFKLWIYDQHPVHVGLLKNGSGWNAAFQWPIGSRGANATIPWAGCIEERHTVSQASYTPRPAGANDLDIDSLPVAGDPDTQWAFVLPDLIYMRGQLANKAVWTRNPISTTNEDMQHNAYGPCPAEAKKLQQWPAASTFSSYVDSLYPEGNTYHDIGLLWGARLLSPTGLFASENASTPQGGKIERHLIFMTDGDPCTDAANYTAYGMNWYDRRTIGDTVEPGGFKCTSGAPLTDQVNARTEALCTAVKNKNITLWVITFGNLAPDTVTRMTNCATPGKYFSANNAAEIQSTFATIANQISSLRLTQ